MTFRPARASLRILVVAFLLAGVVAQARLAADPLGINAIAQAAATIASDAPDYSPGQTVTLTGSGWTPQETVTIVLHRQPLLHPDTVLTSVAGASGTITNTSFAPAADEDGVTFFVTATGSQSGLQATTSFRAVRPTWTGAVSTNWNNAGNWSSGAVPGNRDNVTIPANVASGRYPVVSVIAFADNVTLEAGTGTQPTLTVTSGIFSVSGRFQIDAGTLNVSGGTVLTAANLVVGNGTVNVSGTGVLHMANAFGAVPNDDIVLEAGATFNQSGGTVNTRDFTSPAGVTYNQSGGTFRVYHDFQNSGSYVATAGTIEFAGTGSNNNAFNAPGTNQFFDVVVANGVFTDFSSSVNAQILVRGDWTMNGTADLTGMVTTVTFNGSGAQTIGGSANTTFRNLTVNKSAGVVTLARTTTVTNGNVTVSSGTLDLALFSLNRSAFGGAITVSDGAFLKLGGSNSFPGLYAVHNLGPTSTVDYYGATQPVTGEVYGHLHLGGSGTKTMPDTNLTTQGNFTMSGSASATAAAQVTVNGNFTLGPGTTFGGATYGHVVKGDFSNNGTFTAGFGTFTLNGTSQQAIGGSNSTIFNNLIIANSSGVSLAGVNATVGGVLTFTSGNVTTGAGQFIAISSTGSVSRGSGHVVGNLRKFVATGAPVLTYEIGDSIAYTPVTLAFANVSVAGDATGSTTTGDHPNGASSPVNPLKSVNRYWTWTSSGLGFTTYTATFTFVPGDIDAGANPGNFIVGKFSGGSWTTPLVGTRTPTSTQITGVTTFSDFEIGEGEGVTTLGNGTDPGNTTVAPGGAATMAGAFTFQTATGTDTVSALTVTLTAGTSPAVALVEITDDAGSTVYGSVANPTSNTVAITLSTGITATTSSAQYKIRVTPKSHPAMPVPPGSNYALTAAVSSWASSSLQAGSDSGGTTVTIDNLSPGNVAAATATSGNAQVTLAWTNPADSDLGSLLVLRSPTSAVVDTPAEGATYAVGNAIGSSTVACVAAAPATGCTDTGLTIGTVYHYRIFARDIDGNYATGVVPAGSPVAPNVTTLGGGTDPGSATVKPGAAATMADAFTFQTATGADTITGVTVTLAAGTSAAVSLVEITDAAGSIVYGSVSNPFNDTPLIGLTTPIIATTTSTPYAIRVTPRSHAGMPLPPGSSYGLTAAVTGWTGLNVHAGSDSGGTTITIDNQSPGNVAGATAMSGNTQNTLSWTNPADGDLTTILVLRQPTSVVVDTPTEGVTIYLPGDAVGASTVGCVVTAPATGCTDAGLTNGTVYHYKIFARDANGNYATGVVPTGSPVAPNATTLGDGTPVSNATVAPGGAATMADAFAFRTAIGTDNITAVTVTLASGTSAGVSLVEITDVAGTIVYGSVSNPSSDTLTITLPTNIIATTTTAQYRIRVTPKSHAAMAPPPGTGYALSAHLSDWTGTNAHSGSDSGNTVITIDNLSPGNVTSGIATAGSTHVVLAWVNPLDSDLGTIVVLRQAGSAVGDTPAEGATYSVGNAIGSSTVACVVTAPARACTDTGLTNGTAYHYKLFPRDADGNYATGLVPIGSPATPFTGITVTPTSGLTTTEGGGTATFTIVLTSRPVTDVTIGLSSSDPTEGTVSPSSLLFTTLNWNTPQTVTVTGVNDVLDDGDIAYSIITAPATSTGGYSGLDASDVTVTNTDDDTAGITVTPTAGLSTTEGGGTATFAVVLKTQPSANVTIGLSSSDTTEGTVGPASVTFTSANWNVPQTVTVTGVNDAVADGNVPYTILTAAATSIDSNYNGINPGDVSVVNVDNNTVGIIVNPASGLTTTEAGSTAAFTMALNSQPTADVTIALNSSDTTEGTISATSLTFTSANWNIPQTVIITGVSDALDDGDAAYTIVTSAAVSSDGNYNGLNPIDVAVTNTDDDTSGITVTPTFGLTTTEAGGTATFTIVLTSQPTTDVTIGLTSSNTAEGTVNAASVTFTPANWNVPQTVTITGVDGPQVDGDISYTIVTAPAVSTDSNYSGRNAQDVSVTNADNDIAGITVTPTSGLTTSEAGGTATFTVVLTSQPAADVTIGLSSNDLAQGTVSPASLTFTSVNWNVAQTVTITGVNNPVDDGDVAYSIVTALAASTDLDYSGLNASDVSVTNIDDDTAGIIVTPTSGLTTAEIFGTPATFTVVLTSQPTSDVVIDLSSSDVTEGSVSPASLTFTTANWNVPQTATVSGVNDVIIDGDIAYSIITAPATSGDPKYNGFDASNVSVTNTDSDTAGFFVTPVSGLTTTEAGGTATFTIVMNSQPSANVTVGLSSSDTTEGTVGPASLTFTSVNWNVPQTVTATGVNDVVDDSDIPYTIVTAAATSADSHYNGVNPIDVSVTNDDNDTSGISVSPTFGGTTEAGGTATFTVVLNAQPAANVTIGLSSSNTAEGTISLPSVTFTSANWNVPQTVTATGVGDFLDDGDILYTIVTAPATSTDPKYNGVNASDVSLVNADDDTAGITVTPSAGLTTTEAGGTATFTIVLTAQPTANVAIGLSSTDTTEGTVSVPGVTFTSANWNVPQTVTVTGVADALDDGDITYAIVTAPANSTDLHYDRVDPINVSVSNLDDDTAGITVTPAAGLTTTEGGGTATFNVVLTSQPTASVTIGLSSSDATEGTISQSSLVFTAANWSVPQTVTVTGVNDAVDDGDVAYIVFTAPATSSDPEYGSFDASDVLVTNIDNETSGFTVIPTSGTTTEAGGTTTFTVVLTVQPTSNVTIGLSSSDPTEGTVSLASMTFTSANWNVPQTVTVTGVNDAVDDGDTPYVVRTSVATSGDPNYNGLDPSDVFVTNTNDDFAGITVTPNSGLTTTEGGGTASFTVVLTSQPTADVAIGLSSSNAAEGTVSPAGLTFTSANWNVPQTVTVTGVNDALDDGDRPYIVITAAATSADFSYGGLDASNVLVVNTDDDTSGITVTPTAGLTTTEAGGTATFTVVLGAQPTADVTIGLTSSDTTEGTISQASLTFTSANWNLAQTVTITGVNDNLDDGNIAYTIVTAAATSADLNYAGVNAADVAVTNADNDASGFTVSPMSGPTTEAGGTATFTVVLTSQPTANVTIGLSSSDTTEGTVLPVSLTFTSANWNVAQTVTVTGVNDALDDGDVAYTILTGAATSTDVTYNGVNAADVTATNTDDDAVGITVAPTTGLTTTEAGGTATFTVVLNAQPTADVTIGVSSSDTTEGTVLPARLTFTSANWNVAQTVTVTGVNDLLDDGNVTYTILTAAATSVDVTYNGMNVADVTVTNTDDDAVGITVAPTTGLTTTEAGGIATFTVVLNAQPTADVTIGLSSSDTTEGTVLPASLTFTPANWNVAQTVTVTGVNDLLDDGNVVYTILTAAATSADVTYNGVNAADVTATNTDDDAVGITVTPTTGLTTTEAGGTGTFTVVLNAQPTADVTIAISSSDATEGTVLPASLTFTSVNWSVAQTVTVTGVNDALDDGNVTYTILTAAATSADVTYNGVNAADVTATNSDDDAVGVTVTPTTGLTTTEAGGTGTFTVVLNAQPTADVTIGLSSSDTTEGTVLPASLTFTPANWNVAQTATVTGVNDALDDGNVVYTILTAAATSADVTYNGINAADVTATNSDDDAVGITVAPTTGLTTTEAGGTATFTVVLNTQPTADVAIAVSSSDTTEGTVLPASLTFTSANWNVAQTVTVTGVNDLLDDGNVTYTVLTAAATSADVTYNGLNASDVTVTNTDDDGVGITVTPTSGLTTTEAGGTAQFTVVLATQPTADVTIPISSSDTTEGTVLPVSLTFTSANWNVAQTVTVTGVNDLVDDGNVTYTILTAAATSADVTYNGMNAADVTVTNTDDDAVGITVAPTTGLTTTEAGGTAAFTVVLNTQPTADVTIPVSSSDVTEGTVLPASLTFTSVNWNVAQTVTVTGVNDLLDDGNVVYTILTAAATSADITYNGMNVADVTVTNTDDDAVGITVAPTTGLTTTEAGGTATFTVVLNAQPTADVTIPVSSSDTTEGTVLPASLTFTSVNWNVAQTVTVTGVNDLLDDGNVVYTILTAAATSADITYNGMNVADVTVTNTDDDAVGITVAPTTGLTTTEAGGTATFTVVLNAQPTADVTIPVSSSDTTEGTVLPASLTFTSASWSVPQTVTVTGVNDALDDGNVTYTILTGAATSADITYNGVNAADVTATNTDDDAVGITVAPTTGLTTTEAGGTAQFTVVLNTQPTADVTIPVSSSDVTEGTVLPASLTFTSANWNVAQTVTATGVNDALDDGNVTYTILTGAATSADITYNGVNAADVTATNTDDDAVGITVAPTTGLTTTEAGGTAQFTVVLNTQPTADVTIPVSSSDVTEGTVLPASLTFTSVNWNVAQTVTVTGVNDLLDDGNVTYTVLTGAATSADITYNGVNAADVTATNTDDDAIGITVAPTTGLTTTEAGGTATFTVVLNTQPTADVTIGVSSSDATEGTVGPASLTFTSVNWNVAQTVTVTGVNDLLDDGNVVYTVLTAAATSADVTYNGVNAADVTVINSDDDAVGITVTPTSGLTTTEAGGTAQFTVVLATQPTADVTIGLSSSDVTEGTVLPASLTFTSVNWNVAQTVTVTGVNDLLDDGNVTYTVLTAAAASADGTYNGVNAADVTVTNTDDDAVGITVNPTTGLTTTEAGGTAQFTVVLNTQPTADVTIGLSSSDVTEGTVLPASLTFTSVNWNVAQTVTVTGVNDLLDDGNVTYTILTGAATSADVTYNGVNAADVTVINTDDDAVGITVTPTTGLTTTEAGGTAQFTVVLNTQPAADVTIPVSSSDVTEGTVLPASLTFTSANWNVAQTVTVTGVNDALDDGNVAYTILTAAATSADVTYNGVNAADVTVINSDDDAVGITVTPTTGLTTTEAGGTAQFTVVLNTQPTADVTIPVSSSDVTEGTVLPASLTFTSVNWNVAQTVTATGVNDLLDDGNVTYTVLTAAATSADVTYNGANAGDVTVINTDDDAVGITVTPTTGLTTTEAGGTAAFTVVLNTQPTADVTIGLSSSDTTEGTVLPASLTFTSVNWSVPQTVTVTGANDLLDDGNVVYTILTAAATSADVTYNGVNAADVTATNTDDDAVGITVAPTTGLTTTEAGGTAVFTVVLNTQPTADVTIGLSSSDTTEGTVGPASLTFTPVNWNVAQTVTVTGVNDLLDDGNVTYTVLTAAATSADVTYNGINAADVTATNTDDDAVGITVAPTTGLTTTEAGGTAVFTVVLNTQPTADVTIGLSSSDTTEGTVGPASLTFTPVNWNVAQPVTVTGVNDLRDDGDVVYTILTAAATSTDVTYNGLNAADVAVTNTDDDGAGITVTPTAGLTTTEAGGTAQFTVVLATQPTADVTIGLSSSDVTEGTVLPASLTFTAANWNAAQTVTVTGVNDALNDGNITYTIVTAAATSVDVTYNGMNAADVAVTNTDDDAAGITVSPTTGLTTTEATGTAAFTVVLTTQPTADVTIAMSSSDTTEGTVLPASLTFTPANWNVAQTVTVTGVNDALDDGDVAYTILTAAATSTDLTYNGLNASDVTVTNTDDDAIGITVTPTTGLTTTEAGGTATFTVILTTQPTADVAIGLSSSDMTEGTVLPASLTFTTANWNVAQAVTVTGVTDALDDGDVAYTILTAAATSADVAYNGVNASDVTATNTDDDSTGITVAPATGLITTEAGGTATFTVVLNTQPTVDVTIVLSSSNPAEGTVSPATLTFTPANWNLAQTVTATGVNDLVHDGNVAYTIVTAAATSTDPGYNGVNASDVTVTNTDDDTAGITVTPATGLITTEAGGAATFTVVLNTQPTADVSIGLSSSNPAEGTVSPATLTFTPANWNLAQTVTATGVNDAVDDGDVVYTIVTAPAASTDSNYNAINASDVAATNTDDEVTADLAVTKTNGVAAVTAAGSTTYTIVVSNAGPSSVTGATVTDTAPANVTFGSWTCVASSGSTCPATGAGNIAATVSLPAGGTATFTVPAAISSAASGTVTNTATASVPPGTVDPTPGNNSAADTDSVTPAPILTADLSVRMASPGIPTTYAVVVSNGGPDGANGAIFANPAAIGVTKTTVVCAAAGGATCPASPTVAQVEAGISIPGLPFGGSVTFTIGTTVTAAGTSVLNVATVTPPPGVTDPTPGNNSTANTDTPVDLTVTMTNATDSVIAAGSTTYTVVVTNVGGNTVDGAFVGGGAFGLNRTSLTCIASGGAVCPAGPTVAQLSTGVTVPRLPPGGVVTFTIEATVTAGSGTVSTTIAVTLPAGFVDTNAANNSVTDTDSVTAAPTMADLAVTKSDGVAELQPGGVTTYTIAVTNQGPDAVTGARLIDTAPAGLTFGDWTCVATAGSSCVGGGAGHLSTLVSLLAGGTATFSVPATVEADPPDSIANTAIATVPSGVTDPVPANNSATDVDDAVPPQSLSVDVRAGEPAVVGPAAFEVPYAIEVKNTGSNPLTHLRVSDSLSTAFAQGAPTLTMAAPVTSSGPCTVNSSFSGIGSDSDPGTQLVSGSGLVGVGQSCTFEVRVRLTYPNAAAIPAAAQTNRATAQTSSREGTIVATGEDADSVQLRLPRIDVTKMLTGVAQLGDEPVFDVGYAFVVRNTSEARAPNAQLIDDLAATFAPGAPRITIVSGPSIDGGNASLTLAPSYDGVAATSLLAGSDTMMPGTEQRIVLTVRVRYDSGAAIPAGVDLNNSAIASTSVAPGGTLIVSDTSTDVTESGEPPRADDEPKPTTVHLMPRPRLSVEKIANMFVAEIGDAVQYAVRVRNLGGPTLPEVLVTDRLPLGFRYIAGSARLGSSGTAQPLQDPDGGAGPVLTFPIPAQAATDEVTITYRVRVGVGALQGDGINRADAASGAVRSNMAQARVLVTGGVFTTDACLVGTIFADRNGNGVQDAGEPGVPEVHVNLEDGTGLVSDREGKYSYCGLTPTTHVLHVDRTTLPAGSELTVSSNRNAGDAASLFVDLKSGEVHRTDFIIDATANPDVLDEISVRRERVDIWAPSFADSPRSAIGGRAAAGIGATSRTGLTGVPMAPAQGLRTGGFDAIQQAGGLSPANSNAPEPLPADIGRDTASAPYTPGVLPLSTALRPLMAVGLLDGVVSVSRVKGGLLGPARPEAVFDRAFTRFWRSFDGGQGQYGGRGALFVKGTVAKHYLLTLAYDSDKDERGVLFRDIQPDAFYPVYGDSSLKQFDAQTSGRVYARVDHNLGYVMYGDLQTSSFTPSVQQLGAYNRVLTGVQQHFENKRTMFTVFASHDSLRQVIDEFAALGISGPYSVSNPNGVSGTERVEIITRDRNQPALVLSAVPLTRFTDYEFEPFSGRLLFRRPVPALDERLNPVSLRVTYEVDAGAQKTWVGGANLQVRLGGALQMGGSWIEDSSPASPFRLGSVNTTLRLGRRSTIVVEGAQSTGTINTGIGGTLPVTAAGADPEGFAARVEWRHESSRLIARAFGAITDPGFSNPASTLTPGRTEAGGRARLAISEAVHINGEAIHSEDRLTDGRRDGGLLTVEAKWRPLVFEVGLRRATGQGTPTLSPGAGMPPFGSSSPAGGFGFGSTNTSIDPATGQPMAQAGIAPQLSAGAGAQATNTPLDVMTVRGKLSVLFGKRANVYGEAEQDVREADRRVAAVGTQFLISDRLKLYGRHEFISSLEGPYALTEGQRSYNTVFGASSSYMKDGDVFSEYRLADAISGREAEAAIGLRNQWTVADGVRLHTGFERLHAIAGLERRATAASVGLEYLASTRFKSTGRLEWRNDSASDSWLSTAGFAQKLSRDWTMLARNYYQLTVPDGAPNQVQDRFSIGTAYRDTTTNRVNLLTRYEFRIEDTSGLSAGAPGLSIGSTTDRRVQIVSTHLDVHPVRAWTFSGQYAAKFVNDRAEASADRFGIHLVSSRAGYDLSPRWDLGALTSVMWGGDGGRRSALGGEVGFRLQKNLWFSAGYNVTGFADRDLVSSNFTTRGGFVRLRMKFDESIVPASAPDGP